MKNCFKRWSSIELGIVAALIAVVVVGVITMCAGLTSEKPHATEPARVHGVEPVACYKLEGRFNYVEVCRYDLPNGLTCVYGGHGSGTEPSCMPTPVALEVF